MIKQHNLIESDNSELFLIIQRTYALKELYNNESSLVRLKERIKPLFSYSDAQWEYVEVNFQEDLNDRMLN